MTDQWYYTHAEAVHGPVSGGELRRLVRAGGLLPVDLVWPVGWEPLDGIPAEAALRFPEAGPTDPLAGIAPPSFPGWLPELAAALASGEDLAALPGPPPEAWLPDVSRGEEPPFPSTEGS
jgi:GYF domain 2